MRYYVIIGVPNPNRTAWDNPEKGFSLLDMETGRYVEVEGRQVFFTLSELPEGITEEVLQDQKAQAAKDPLRDKMLKLLNLLDPDVEESEFLVWRGYEGSWMLWGPWGFYPTEYDDQKVSRESALDSSIRNLEHAARNVEHVTG